jgi:hypothetical protein
LCHWLAEFRPLLLDSGYVLLPNFGNEGRNPTAMVRFLPVSLESGPVCPDIGEGGWNLAIYAGSQQNWSGFDIVQLDSARTGQILTNFRRTLVIGIR